MILPIPIDPEVSERVARLDIAFSRYGLDEFGVSRRHLAQFFTLLALMYRRYFRVTAHDIQNVPDRGRAMLVGNHSGGLPVDGGMVIASLLLDHEPPRLAHGMVEKFAQSWPFLSSWFCRVGQLPGLTEHAVRLLKAERVLMVFPEGARGTGKLYKDRYTLVRFGTGFMRLALQTKTPVVPFAFIGGEEALPTMFHFTALAKLVGAPYWPVPPYIVPVPLPVACHIHYGEPMTFDGDGTESDEIIHKYVDAVKSRIEGLIAKGREERRALVKAAG
jgi:1-acyl-sn-glycerol-3-phosphate acyltransferase